MSYVEWIVDYGKLIMSYGKLIVDYGKWIVSYGKWIEDYDAVREIEKNVKGKKKVDYSTIMGNNLLNIIRLQNGSILLLVVSTLYRMQRIFVGMLS